MLAILSMMLAFALSLSHVYLFCLVVGLAFAVISGVLGGLGGGEADVDVDVDTGADFGGADLADGSVHFSPLSPVVLSMFVTSFGATGLLIHDGFGLKSWFFSLPLATVSGLVVAGITFYLFARLMGWAQGSSQASAREALGGEAEVIIPIPAGGVGRIAYTLRDRRFTAPARSVDGQAVANHASVVIVRMAGSTVLVRPSDEEQLKKLTDEPKD